MLTNTPFAISLPTQVLFGDGQSKKVVQFLPADKGVVVFVRGRSGAASDGVAKLLRQTGFELLDVICPTEPTVAAVNAAVDLVGKTKVLAVVACGGGSVLDTGKALALCLASGVALTDDLSAVPENVRQGPRSLRLIAIPTTAGTGAEVTANAVLGLSSEQSKLSLRGRALCPDVALVDPQLIQGAPPVVKLHAALDAVVQSIEALCSSHASPFTDSLVAPNLSRGLHALRSIQSPNAIGACRDLAWTALASGAALANGGLGAVHGLAAVVGGRFDAPHGALCGRLLAPVLRCNLSKASPGSESHVKIDHCVEAIARVFPPKDRTDDLSGFEAWLTANELPRLRAFGLHRQDFDALSVGAVKASSSAKNPVVLDAVEFQGILHASY